MLTEQSAYTILEKAFPDASYKNIKKGVENLKKAGIVVGNTMNNFSSGIRIIPDQATEEEIAEWEKYNGKGSFSDGSSPKKFGEPIQVKDEETFKSIFNKTKKGNKYEY